MKAIFWVGKSTIFGRLIRLFKGTGSSHAEILFSDGYAGTSDKGLGGIAIYPLNYKSHEWVSIDIPCTPEEEADVRKFFEEDEKGCGYDMKGIVFAQLFRWNIQSKDKWFCSEACTAALQRVKGLKFLHNLKPHNVDPGKLFKLLCENLN
jgi:hypothetical protein